jgi:hypothetical protein
VTATGWGAREPRHRPLPPRGGRRIAVVAAAIGAFAAGQWLVQMGWHRGGWYTPRFIDRLLFPGNWPSATHLVPELQRPLEVGDRIPDGPPGTAWFVVDRVDPPKLLVLHSTTHLPASWRARLGAAVDWSGPSPWPTPAEAARGCCCASGAGPGRGG